MAEARKCDRCGKLFEAYIKRPGDKKASAFNVLELKKAKIDGAWYEVKEYDLCDECSKELQDWLEHYKFPANEDEEHTMCDDCAKQGTNNCHCDCAREFEPKTKIDITKLHSTCMLLKNLGVGAADCCKENKGIADKCESCSMRAKCRELSEKYL